MPTPATRLRSDNGDSHVNRPAGSDRVRRRTWFIPGPARLRPSMKSIHLTRTPTPGSVGFVLKLALRSILALLLSTGPARAQAVPEPPRRQDGYLQETIEVAPGVWAFVQPRFQVQPIGNVTVIEQSDGLVLVDAGGSPGSARRITAEIRRLSPKPVTAVNRV